MSTKTNDGNRRTGAKVKSSTSVTAKRHPRRSDWSLWLMTSGLTLFFTASFLTAPEGATRDGDYLPIILLFLLTLLAAAISYYHEISRTVGKDGISEQNDDLQSSNGLSDSRTNVVPSVRRSKLTVWADVAFTLFLVWTTASYIKLVVCHSGEIRYATNYFWTFITPALLYAWLRYFRKLLSPSILAVLFMTLLCCALAQSAFSLYSFAYATPRLQAAYRSDPEKVLKENGLVFQENSSERLLFEKRLLESTEPFGTYGLANTLAGFLSPVLLLVVMCAPVIIRQCRQREVAATYDINLTINPTLRVFILISYLLFIVLLSFILALTKSRAGVLSLFIGLVLWGITFLCAKLRQGGRLPQVGIKTIACGIGVVAVLTVGLFATKTIDAEVFTQASKSLGYRMDYWRASSQIIKDFPIFGCGPGEFQSVYARYILPTASEFIADPHNFAFEIASVLGVPALIFFLTFVALLTVGAIKASCSRNTQTDAAASPLLPPGDTSGHFESHKSIAAMIQTDNTEEQVTRSKAFCFGLIGALLGMISLFLFSSLQATPIDLVFYPFGALSILAIFVIANIFNRKAILFNIRQMLPPSVLLITILSLLLNLSVAGGIAYPVIATLLFLLFATLANQIDEANDKDAVETSFVQRNNLRRRALQVTVVALILLGLFYYTGFKPRCNSFLFKLRYNGTDPVATIYQEALELAEPEKIDAYSSDVALLFYYYATNQFITTHSETARANWEKMREHVIRTSPNSATVRERCAQSDLIYYHRSSRDKQLLTSALEFSCAATELSPTDAKKHYAVVEIARLANEIEIAREHARIALELDRQTPHEDRKLVTEQRDELLVFLNEEIQ